MPDWASFALSKIISAFISAIVGSGFDASSAKHAATNNKGTSLFIEENRFVMILIQQCTACRQ